MKKISIFCLLVAFTASISAQIVLQEIPDYKFQHANGLDVDVNADGKLDIFIGGNDFPQRSEYERIGSTGSPAYYRTLLLLWSKAQNEFIEGASNFLTNSRPYHAFADFDGDNILDLVSCSHGSYAAFPEDWGLFIGDGNGNFNREEITFDDSNYEFFPRAAVVTDVNLDGKPDIICVGYGGSYGTSSYVDFGGILINDGEFVGDTKFKVTGRNLFAPHAWSYPGLYVLDINNDGYPDFLITASDASDNAIADKSFFDVFVNKGANAPGEFERIHICETLQTPAQYLGPVLIQDFTGNGYLDIVVTGKTGSSSVSVMRHYTNNGDGSFELNTQTNLTDSICKDIRNESSTDTQAKAFDWDGDGLPDILINGYVSAKPSTQTGYWWKNNGEGNFSASQRLPGASNSCMMFPDWDGDGVRDMFTVGKTTSTTYLTQGGSNYFEGMVTKGEAPVNVKPSAPDGLNVAVNGNEVRLSWNVATDDKTPAASLSYEYYILNSEGEVINNCRSIIGGALDGSRMVLALGNAFLSKSVTLNHLPAGDYTWGVQAIDACYEASVFATGEFTVGNTAISQTTVPNVKITSNNQTLTVKTKGQTTLRLVDLSGKILEESQFNRSYSKALPGKGVFLVELNVSGQRIIKKIII
ncbi:MAG: T9SS type A sorting domain-containing protein [Candidatus Symbiothrix sp.]|jgi:hypothetical protein|nr:T9SS type A sorting domain-containing protein [Candidatus Symbiothrix sp.]